MALKILKKSIKTLLKTPLLLTTTLLILPFTTALLLSQSASPSSSRPLRTLSSRIFSLFDAAGLPASSQFFSLLSLKLSQTVLSFLVSLPFTLTFLTLAKAVIVRRVLKLRGSIVRLWLWMGAAYVFNSFVVLSANAAVVAVMFAGFNVADFLGLESESWVLVMSAAGAVLYSVVIANTMVVCSLSVVVSGIHGCCGYLSLLKSCVLLRGRESTAITVALPANLAMAVLEALFQYRIARPYLHFGGLSGPFVVEALVILLVYSLFITLDVVVSCFMYISCDDSLPELEPDDKAYV